MKQLQIALVVIVFLATNNSQFAFADANPQLRHILEGFSKKVSPGQYRQIVQGIDASPSLTSQLNNLASAGLLTSFDMTTEEQVEATKKIRFGASLDKGTFLFTAAFMNVISSSQPFDVRSNDDIAPNNMTFVLGHLAAHLQNAASMNDALSHLTPGSNTGAALVAYKLLDEGKADIQGWNDVIDAAVSQNGGKPLTGQQIAYLMVSLRYRAILIKATQKTDYHKATFAQSGRIELLNDNISAVSEAVATSAINDIE